MIPDLSQRSRQSEEMDARDSDPRKLFRTLDQFKSVNRLFSRVRGPLKAQLFPLLSPHQDTHLLDLGAGGCDIPVWLLTQAKKKGLRLRITAVDSDPRVIEHARNCHAQVKGLSIIQADALDLEALAPFDFIFANHFLHHLDDQEIKTVLHNSHQLASKGYLFSDLKRSTFSYRAYSIISLCYRDSFTRKDGLISICKGFTPQELKHFAPAENVQVTQKFPGRLYLSFVPQIPSSTSDESSQTQFTEGLGNGDAP
ncbi:methyltransferase domain-containing protein [Kiritimatiellota bacterium B12222]|nr:methyltransferase domain-containing protein [Kiritimatiellota bacterium B12222]